MKARKKVRGDAWKIIMDSVLIDSLFVLRRLGDDFFNFMNQNIPFYLNICKKVL